MMISDEVDSQKDTRLFNLGKSVNIAQFVSFTPNGRQRYCCLKNNRLNHKFPSVSAAIRNLIDASQSKKVNIRSFRLSDEKSQEFIYGIDSLDHALNALSRLQTSGLHTIVSETIGGNDGGVSGVVMGDLIEFGPGASTRVVEEGNVVSLPRPVGELMLSIVYGFSVNFENFARSSRIEFSVHPLRQGFRGEHLVYWEQENCYPDTIASSPRWPNTFSRMIGDKTYGLLLAHIMKLPVPMTTVISRSVAPFRFGTSTRTAEVWLRTSPSDQSPGLFPTCLGWQDPFSLLANCDPSGSKIAAVLSQESVKTVYSGSLITYATGSVTIEGVSGPGDRFMLGGAPEQLPRRVIAAVQRLHQIAIKSFGPVSIEWVYDGNDVWVVQLHARSSPGDQSIIYPGDPVDFERFHVGAGLDALRRLINQIDKGKIGVILVGSVGVTSHFGDVLRNAQVPSRVEHP